MIVRLKIIYREMLKDLRGYFTKNDGQKRLMEIIYLSIHYKLRVKHT